MVGIVIVVGLIGGVAVWFLMKAVCNRLAMWNHWRFLWWFMVGIAACWTLLAWRFISPYFHLGTAPEAGFAGIEFLFVKLPIWIACYLPGIVLLFVLLTTVPRKVQESERSLPDSAAILLAMLVLVPFIPAIGLEVSGLLSQQQKQEERQQWEDVGAYASHADGMVYYVRFESISDVRLLPLVQETDIKILRLDKIEVNDDDLVHIRGLHKIYDLSISDTQITDRGVSNLKTLRNMRLLNLANTQISDAGLASLADMHDLQELSLAGTKITDDGLRTLLPISAHLRKLNIEETNISDEGLRHLTALSELRSLRLSGCNVTLEAIEQLKMALPRCRISFPGFENQRVPLAERMK